MTSVYTTLDRRDFQCSSEPHFSCANLMFINHVTVLVADKKRAKNFYVDRLGLRSITVGRSLWIVVGRQFIHVAQNSGIPISGSFYHFAIGVEDLRSYLDRIIANHVDVFDLDESIRPISVNERLDVHPRQYFVRDPDGNLIEFHDAKDEYFLTGKNV